MKLEADFQGIPEDAVFEFGISILVYMDEDARSKYAIQTVGGGSAAYVLGIMELAKKTLLEMNDT